MKTLSTIQVLPNFYLLMGMEHPQAKPWGGGIQSCGEKPEGEYCLGGKAKAFASQRAILETQMNLWALHLFIIKPQNNHRQITIL